MTLADIRAQSAAYTKAAMPVSSGSAFHKLTQKNNAFLNGTTRRDEFNKKKEDRTEAFSPAVKKTDKPVSTTSYFSIAIAGIN